MVSFARERLAALGDPVVAALEAGFTRFRPVLMTALAMIIGMAPMALGLGEGGEQNAPLGRAVIGGLIFATVATLMFVPVVFSLAHGRKAACRPTPARTASRSRHRRSLCLAPEVLRHTPPAWLKPARLGRRWRGRADRRRRPGQPRPGRPGPEDLDRRPRRSRRSA